MTWALIRKDVRLLRPVLIMTAVVALFFYVLVPGGWWVANQFSPDRVDSRNGVEELFKGANVCVWLFLYLIYAAIGGTAFAAERRERWGDLAAMLPVSQRRSIGVKLLVGAIACSSLAIANAVATVTIIYVAEWHDMLALALRVMWNTQLRPYGLPAAVAVLMVGAVVEILLRRQSWPRRFFVGVMTLTVLFVIDLAFTAHSLTISLTLPSGELLTMLLNQASTYEAFAITFFGYAWLMSSMLRSPAIATAISIGLIVAMFATWMNYANQMGYYHSYQPGNPAIQRLLLWLLATSGVASVVTGAVVQRHRGTP